MAMAAGTDQTVDRDRPATLQASWTSRLIGALEEWPPLGQASGAVTKLLDPLRRRPQAKQVEDLLHGRWLGHALHPVLVDLPIGFWTSAMLLELVGARKSARLLTAAGSVSALGAALTGLADWSVTDGREQRLGLLHGLLNVTALGFQAASLPSRRHYRSLSFIGSFIATGSAYLGGELIMDRGLMVNHDAWLAGPSQWTALCAVNDLPDGSAKGLKVDGRTVLVHRKGREVSAIEATCSHAGGPLQEGEIQDGAVTCPWHGSRFRLADGACLAGPATFPQLRLEARIRDGQIEVRGRKG